MIKVESKKAAWELVSRLFPTDYELDKCRSKNAGYNIYYTTASGKNAWISDLGDRLEMNYPNGSSENIWIEEKPDVVAFVGMYHDKKIFGDVTVKEVREVVYHNVQGFVNKTCMIDGCRTFGTKKNALHNAAILMGLPYKEYMQLRRKSGSCGTVEGYDPQKGKVN